MRASSVRPPPKVIAHRGASSLCPENTAAAFDRALADGCDGIELDLQLTSDGVPVVYHDPTLTRVGLPRRRVASVMLAELRRLDFGGWFERGYRGERVLTLDQVLSRYARRTGLLLELKTRSGRGTSDWNRRLAQAVAAAIHKRGLESRLHVLCFEPVVLRAALEANPRLRCVLNVGPSSLTPRTSFARFRSLWLKDLPLAALSFDIRVLTKRLVAGAHRRGLSVMTFTCNRPARVRAALEAGVDVIMSDRPSWLREQLAGRVE